MPRTHTRAQELLGAVHAAGIYWTCSTLSDVRLLLRGMGLEADLACLAQGHVCLHNV